MRAVTVLVLLPWTLTCASQLGCPNKCDCDYRAYNMTCNNTDLTRFPPYMVWCPESLVAVNNNITKLENGSFTPCGDTIILLNLSNAGIQEIERGAFDEFSKLETLDLRKNRVTQIWEDIFVGLSSINNIFFDHSFVKTAKGGKQICESKEESRGTLFFTHNNLTKIEAGFPKGIQTLYLDYNEIDEITPEQAVYPLITLETLSLKGNKIATIARHAFTCMKNATWFQNEDSPLKKLKYIVLDDNIIRDIEPFAFEGLPQVENINISRNNLVQLKANMFRSLTSLSKLCLIQSKIETVQPETFRDLDNLIELNMAGNKIKFLEDDVFLDLPRLEILKLTNNRIHFVKKEMFNGLYELKLLNLSYNALTHLKRASFKGLDKMEVLDLSHNEISTTEQDAFQNLTALDKLILDYNKMVKVQPLTFQEIPSLRELTLRYNQMTSLSPELDEKLNILRTDLYLRGNTIEVPEPKDKINLEKLLILDLSHNRFQDLPPGLFRNASRIFSLRLNNNELQFLRSTALSGLRRVYELNLHNNPLRCDCALVGTYLYTTRNRIDTKLFSDTQPICKYPFKYKNMEWDVLQDVYNSSECQPLQPLAAANQAGLFVVGPILLIIIGVLTFYFQRIVRKIISKY